MSRLINQPLARLTAATRSIAKGRVPDPLPERGPEEIREANRSFNQMVADLNRVESDRALVLAGISHDLRTPLARMQLEVEMANLSADARQGMQSDLHQMDAIIGQFLDYAKPTDSATFIPVDLGRGVARLRASCWPSSAICGCTPTFLKKCLWFGGNLGTDLKRVFNNLIENARRYGKAANSDFAELDLACHASSGSVVVTIADHGPGVPEADIERLLRPFTRLDAARGQANGAGLGLAIVERAVKRHDGIMRVSNRATGGLAVEISLPMA